MEQYCYIAGSLYFTIELIMLVIPSKLSNSVVPIPDNLTPDSKEFKDVITSRMIPLMNLMFSPDFLKTKAT